MGVVAFFVGDHVLECVQLVVIAEFVFNWEDFVRLEDLVVEDVVGAADLKGLVVVGGLFRGEVGHLLQGTRR